MRASMESYLERAMKAQAVILQAVAKKITLWRAAEIIGLSDRSMRRRRERYETHGYDGLRWRVRGCHRLGAGGDGEEPGTDACFSEARFRSFHGLVVVPSGPLGFGFNLFFRLRPVFFVFVWRACSMPELGIAHPNERIRRAAGRWAQPRRSEHLDRLDVWSEFVKKIAARASRDTAISSAYAGGGACLEFEAW